MLNYETFNIQRKAPVAQGSIKITYGTIGTITGYREEATAEFSSIATGQYGRTHRIHSDESDADIKVGDRLVSQEDSQKYDVQAVRRNTTAPLRRIEITGVEHIKQ